MQAFTSYRPNHRVLTCVTLMDPEYLLPYLGI